MRGMGGGGDGGAVLCFPTGPKFKDSISGKGGGDGLEMSLYIDSEKNHRTTP